MAETHVLSALKRRYALTLGQSAANPASNALADDLAHLGAVILMFSPCEDLGAIAPIRPYKANRERWSRTALRILRTAERPLRTRELARMIMRARGVDLEDERRLVSIACTLQAVLGRMAVQGLIRVTGKPRRWSVSA
jgi:hypothetical protein